MNFEELFWSNKLNKITLEDLSVGIERATNLWFPSGIKRRIKYKSIELGEAYDIGLNIARSLHGIEPSEERKSNFLDEIKGIFMIVDPINYIIYSLEENIERNYNEYNLEPIRLILKAHEIGHLLGHSLVPNLTERYKIFSIDKAKGNKVNSIDEAFADYALINFFESNNLRGGYVSVDLYIKCRRNYDERNGTYLNNLLSSEDPVKYVGEELVKVLLA